MRIFKSFLVVLLLASNMSLFAQMNNSDIEESLAKAKESIRKYCEITPYQSKLCDTYGFKPTRETLEKFHRICDNWDVKKDGPKAKGCENLLPLPPVAPKKP